MDDVDLRTLERATHILGLLILKERAVAEASERLSGELLTELMVGPRDQPYAALPHPGPQHRRGTDLVDTLGAYYGHRSNVAATARALHVHVNTLLKRLDRAGNVLGLDWRHENDLELQLVLRLHQLRAIATAPS